MLDKFNNEYVYMSDKSFIQNKNIKKELRFDVNQEIIYKSITCIGGESYLYGLTNNIIIDIAHYTNSKYIYNDANINNGKYNKRMINNLIDYNTYNNYKNSDILILNLASLNLKLLTEINKRFYNKIIIINCHHNEFWKRINLLVNYKLIKRKHYITNIISNNKIYKYFITINILERKKDKPIFIPLGLSCAVAYQLNILGLRYESYPYDWCSLTLNKLIESLEDILINNNIENFVNFKLKKFSDNHPLLNDEGSKGGSKLLINDYGIKFAHELSKDKTEEELKEKIKDRIHRFINILNSTKIIKFIILIPNKLNINLDKLENLLKIKNNNQFELIKIKREDEEDWRCNKIEWNKYIFS
jgi:hypothetical protein